MWSKLPIMVQGALLGFVLAVVLIVFEYSAIKREVAERSKRVAKKVEWDANQASRMRNMLTFGVTLTVGFALGAWWVWG